MKSNAKDIMLVLQKLNKYIIIRQSNHLQPKYHEMMYVNPLTQKRR